MSEFKIRLAKLSDAEEILNIYAPFILNTTISFEYDVPSIDEVQSRISEYSRDYPWLVAESTSGSIAGYAYGMAHRKREAYQWTAESSVYIHQDHRGHGLGRELYERLFTIFKRQNLCTVFAGFTNPNAASQKFHESMGFTLLGTYHNTGYKFDKWHDVSWMEKTLQLPANPKPFIPLHSLSPDIILRSLT